MLGKGLGGDLILLNRVSRKMTISSILQVKPQKFQVKPDKRVKTVYFYNKFILQDVPAELAY